MGAEYLALVSLLKSVRPLNQFAWDGVQNCMAIVLHVGRVALGIWAETTCVRVCTDCGGSQERSADNANITRLALAIVQDSEQRRLNRHIERSHAGLLAAFPPSKGTLTLQILPQRSMGKQAGLARELRRDPTIDTSTGSVSLRRRSVGVGVWSLGLAVLRMWVLAQVTRYQLCISCSNSF